MKMAQNISHFNSRKQTYSRSPSVKSVFPIQALKTLVSERMREMQKTLISTTETVKLKSRIENLERENRELHSYTRRLEDTVKDLLSKQKRKVEGRTCKSVQTEDREVRIECGIMPTLVPLIPPAN